MAESKELSLVEAQFSLVPRNLTEAMEFAKLIANTSLVPKSYRDKEGKVNPGDVLISVQMGLEVGLKPLQAIQNIAVINGQPTIWGDAMKGLVQQSGLMEYCVETWDEKTQTATCKVKRKGKPECVRTFSMKDAVTAGLAEKDTYKKYTQRMCPHRARSYALRDEFADVLKGLQCREEVEDYEVVGTSPEGHSIMMPRRKSGAVPAQSSEPLVVPSSDISEAVDKFSQEVGPSKAGVTAPKPVDRSKLQKYLVMDSVQKNGNGKTFYSVTLQGASGKDFSATTFHSKLHDEALRLKGDFALVEIKDNPSKDGKTVYKNVTHIEAAPKEMAAETEAPTDEPGSAG